MEGYGWKLVQSTTNRTVGILTTKDLERNVTVRNPLSLSYSSHKGRPWGKGGVKVTLSF
jgi:hypothetical protein